LIDAVKVLEDVRGIAFTQFSSADVVRHPLVARIVDAYEEAGLAHAAAEQLNTQSRTQGKDGGKK
ncbi:MAG: PhoH family protein, partial [Janthinobacterium lividum]